MDHDLKLGPGGIREIEFVAQAQQLIWGGRYPELQESGVTVILRDWLSLSLCRRTMFRLCWTPITSCATVNTHCRLNRTGRTHLLPTDPVSQSRLARAMGYPDLRKVSVMRLKLSGAV